MVAVSRTSKAALCLLALCTSTGSTGSSVSNLEKQPCVFWLHVKAMAAVSASSPPGRGWGFSCHVAQQPPLHLNAMPALVCSLGIIDFAQAMPVSGLCSAVCWVGIAQDLLSLSGLVPLSGLCSAFCGAGVARSLVWCQCVGPLLCGLWSGHLPAGTGLRTGRSAPCWP